MLRQDITLEEMNHVLKINEKMYFPCLYTNLYYDNCVPNIKQALDRSVCSLHSQQREAQHRNCWNCLRSNIPLLINKSSIVDLEPN